jgi:hypothetical protein
LIEVTVASVIIALAVLSIVAAQQAFHQQNDAAGKTGLALSLANELREITLALPVHDPIAGDASFGPESNETDDDPHVMVTYFDDLDDFANTDGSGMTFSPPIDALRQPYPNMDGWSQRITVENVAPNDVGGAAVTPGSTDVLRLTVRVHYDDPDGVTDPVEMGRLSWISAGVPN